VNGRNETRNKYNYSNLVLKILSTSIRHSPSEELARLSTGGKKLKASKFAVVATLLFILILAALPTASAGPTVETSIPDITLNEDDEAVGVINLNDYFSTDGGQLIFSSIMVDSKSEVTIHEDGFVDFSAPADWYGTEVVTFIASDGEQEARDTILITVQPVNDAPYISTPLPGQLAFMEDGILANAFNINAHFTDVDSTLTFSHSSEDIIVHISHDGYVDLSAPPDWQGTEDVTLSASDGTLEVFDTMTVIVNPVNDAPRSVANPGTISLDDESPTKTLSLDEFFMDADGEAMNYEFSGNSKIECRLDRQQGTLRFSAPDDFHGEEVITVRAMDSHGTSSSIQVVVVASGGESASGLLFYSLGLVLALAVAAVRLSAARERGPPKSPVKLDDYRHFRGY
jgi:hypothetical protein